MAKMHPSSVPEHIRGDPKRSSELAVYERLREQLPGDFVCYYSAPWHLADADGAERDGEADFVIAHPRDGLLMLEVKGGRVSRRSEDAQWLSTDRNGLTFRIKDPVAQARASKHAIVMKLRAQAALKSRYVKAAHAVVLPGSARPLKSLGADGPLELIAFGDDMTDLGEWVRARMASVDPDAEELGLSGMAAVHELLAGRFELKAHIGVSVADDARRIEVLTAEQAWLLESFEDNPQMAISGGAGSGKTVLAIEKARRSADAGQRTLITCYNRGLAAYLRRTLRDVPNLTVGSFHSTCRHLAKEAGVELRAGSEVEMNDAILPNALLDAVDARPDLKFDTIVVDEGQDFDDRWLDTLRLSLSDVDGGGFFVFFDDNQILFKRGDKFIISLPTAKHRLNRNLRNTRRIYEATMAWYQGRAIHPAGPEGSPVEWVLCKDAADARRKAETEITNIIRRREIQPGHIAVLSAASQDEISSRSRILGVTRTCCAEEANADCVVYDTVRRFKGLSRPCVFLIDTHLLSEQELVYVALSRANVLLHVYGTREDNERLARGLSEIA